MFIGHFGVGLGAKRFAPTVSLGALILACQFADLVWPTLVLAGVERVRIEPGATLVSPLDLAYYPYSHSLAMLILWGLALGFTYRALARAPTRAALVLAAAVVSHWLLDVIVHRPDVPLAPGFGPKLGLGLWNSLPLTLLVEFGLFALGTAAYLRATRARDRAGTIGLWALVVFLTLVELANLFGPPPPSATAVAWAAESMWLLVAWGYWLDRHREPRPAI